MKKNKTVRVRTKISQEISVPPETFQMGRKLFHLAGILFPLFWALDPFQNSLPFADPARTILFVVLLLAFIFQMMVEYLRFRFAFWQKLFVMLVGKILKQDEGQNINGSIPYFLANLILVAFAQREVAIVSMMFLIIGDPTAAFFGSRYGSWRLTNGKSFQGSLAAIFAATAGGIFFLWLHSLRHPQHLFFSLQFPIPPSLTLLLTAAFAAFIAELFSGRGVRDDNLTIPLTAALALALGLYYWGFSPSVLFFSPAQLFDAIP